MKKVVFIKEIEHEKNMFSDLMETVNVRLDRTDYTQQVGFYTRVDYALRLGRNRSDQNADMPLALFHYLVDPVTPNQDANVYRPIDTAKMMKILEEGYDFVLFGYYSDSHLIPDYTLIKDAKYVVRNDKEVLIDYDTKEPIVNDQTQGIAFVTTLFGMVKFANLPVYYLILEQGLVKISDGFDYDDVANDTMYHLINKGTVKEDFITPTFGPDVTQVGNTLLCKTDSFTIDIFGDSLYKKYLGNDPIPDLGTGIVVDTNLNVPVQGGNKLTVNLTKPIGYVKFSFQQSKFFSMIQPEESLTFEYVVLKTD